MIFKPFTWITHQTELRKPIACFILTFFVVLPLLLKDNANSPYSKWLAKESDASTRLIRYRAANSYMYLRDIKYLAHLSSSDRKKLSNWHENATFKLLVTVITTSRLNHGSAAQSSYNPNYLTQTVARLARLETNKHSTQFTDLKLLICDVDSTRHKEATLMSSVVEIVHKHVDHGQYLHHLELEKRDYVNCLNQSLGRHADYILMVEDDALAHFDLLDKLDHLLWHRIPKIYNTSAFFKLFHPSRLNGFITADINRLMEWVAIAGLLEHLLMLVTYLFNIEYTTQRNSRVGRFIYFMLLLLAIGRINIEQIRTVSPQLYRLVPTPSCCTPALMFTPNGALQMVKYLNTVTCCKGYAKDSAMDDFPRSTRLQTWFFEPKLFTHIGVYTTLNDKVVDPAFVD